MSRLFVLLVALVLCESVSLSSILQPEDVSLLAVVEAATPGSPAVDDEIPAEICRESLGVNAAGAVSVTQFSASGQFKAKAAADSVWKAQNGRLNKKGNCWRPQLDNNQQWIQVDLGEMKRITKIVTQGCDVKTDKNEDMYVKTYSIEYSQDSKLFVDYAGGLPLAGNTNRQTAVEHKLEAFTGRWLRILPVTWNTHIGLRFEVYGCQDKRGPRGEKGERGEQGLQGNVGVHGAKGEQGIKGERGDQGLMGHRGEAGPKGDKGDRGLQGAPGTVGAKGDKGLQGERGDVGAVGPKGIKGDKGDQGLRGAAGQRGFTGYKGEKGDKGDAGAKGTRGEKGENGTPGMPGSVGAPGKQGDPGKDGINGQPGPAGPVGAAGPRGFPGADGKDGEKGDQGAPGRDGSPDDRLRINRLESLVLDLSGKLKDTTEQLSMARNSPVPRPISVPVMDKPAQGGSAAAEGQGGSAAEGGKGGGAGMSQTLAEVAQQLLNMQRDMAPHAHQ